MKKFILLALPLLFAACEKNPVEPPPPVTHPPMRHLGLGNSSVKFGQHEIVNVDGDNINDLLFSTILVGDPVGRRDRRMYFVSAGFDVFLLSDAADQTPVLNSGDPITLENKPGYNWFNASSILLAQKIIEETGPEHWEGNWKNAGHKFLAIQIRKDNLRYNGWVEVSFKTDTEELILHRAAIAMEAGKTVTAGH